MRVGVLRYYQVYSLFETEVVLRGVALHFAGLLPVSQYQCLCLLCEIVEIIIKPSLLQDDICTKLYQHHKLFEKVYGKWKVSVNYHLALHLPDVVADYGPLHGYWCFGYERMNGVLADIPNSNRNIEIRILNKIIQQFCFNCYTDPLTPMDETFMSKALIELTSVDRNV